MEGCSARCGRGRVTGVDVERDANKCTTAVSVGIEATDGLPLGLPETLWP
jgi:hypothetical protein